jgi:hypothetical protein
METDSERELEKVTDVYDNVLVIVLEHVCDCDSDDDGETRLESEIVGLNVFDFDLETVEAEKDGECESEEQADGVYETVNVSEWVNNFE